MTKTDYEQFVTHLFHLSTNIGIRPAARALGINEERAKKIAQRRNFRISLLRPKWLNRSDAQNVPTNPHAIETTHKVIQHYGERAKIGAVIAGAKAFEHLADQDGVSLCKPALAISADQWSKATDRAAGWSAERARGATVQVAVVNLPSAQDDQQRADIDAKLDMIAKRLRETSTE